ncbi:Atlastin-3 [Thelohanellus kitauei]|uniref:Atlastin-3 n=1 Tax=Thelohanellus kitauei TaxID=669202 RepID=A0A0C2J8S2_THEKT|nr:Atlastin-3 [Thelohanellus kitauei]
MEKICGGSMPYVPEEELKEKHEKMRDDAIAQFTHSKKFGDNDISIKFQAQLEQDISHLFEHYYKVNMSKQVNSFKFIITAFIVMIASLMISQILDLIGLDFLMAPFHLISVLLLLLILFCAYAQFYGGFSGVLYKLNLIPDYLMREIKKLVIEKYHPVKIE